MQQYMEHRYNLAAQAMMYVVTVSKPTYICIQHMYADAGVPGHNHNVHHWMGSRRVLAWLLHQICIGIQRQCCT